MPIHSAIKLARIQLGKIRIRPLSSFSVVSLLVSPGCVFCTRRLPRLSIFERVSVAGSGGVYPEPIPSENHSTVAKQLFILIRILFAGIALATLANYPMLAAGYATDTAAESAASASLPIVVSQVSKDANQRNSSQRSKSNSRKANAEERKKRINKQRDRVSKESQKTSESWDHTLSAEGQYDLSVNQYLDESRVKARWPSRSHRLSAALKGELLGPIRSGWTLRGIATDIVPARSLQAENRYNIDTELHEARIFTQGSFYRVDIGQFVTSWGETFGISVIDIVSPNNYSDPLELNAERRKLSNLKVRSNLYFSNWTIDIIAQPSPKLPQLPRRDDVFSRSGGSVQRQEHKEDIEAAIKANLLLGSLDAGAFVMRHQSREPLFKIRLDQDIVVSSQTSAAMMSYGLTTSYAAGGTVFRIDSIYQPNSPASFNENQTLVTQAVIRGIAAADHNLNNGDNFGAQYHFNRYGNRQARHYLSLNCTLQYFQNQLEVESFLYGEILGREIWVRPRFEYHYSESVSLSILADIIWAESEQIQGNSETLNGLDGHDRIQFNLELSI